MAILDWSIHKANEKPTKQDYNVETQFYPDSTPAEETASDGNERVFQTIGSILQIASSALLFTGNFELANTVYGIHGILTAVVSLSDEGGSALEEYKSISKDLAKLPQKFKDTLKEEKIREHASALQTIHDSLADHTTILKSQRPEDSVVLDEYVKRLENELENLDSNSLPQRISDLTDLQMWQWSVGRTILLDSISVLFTIRSHLARIYTMRAMQYAKENKLDDAKKQQSKFFNNLNSMECELRRDIERVKVAFEKVAEDRVGKCTMSHKKIPNTGGRFVGFLGLLGGNNDTRVDRTEFEIKRKDDFSGRENTHALVVLDEELDKRPAEATREIEKNKEDTKHGYQEEVKKHVRRAFANTGTIFAAWEKQVECALKLLTPQPPAGKPVIKGYQFVEAIPDALKGAAMVSYCYSLRATRKVTHNGHTEDVESRMSEWTDPQKLEKDNELNLPVLVLDDRDFYLQTVRTIYRRVDGTNHPDHGKQVLVDRITGNGKIEWVDKVKQTPHGKD